MRVQTASRLWPDWCLAGPPARLAHRERRDQRRLGAGVIAVVQVVDRYVPVVERCLLDALQPEDLGVEVVVLLGASDAQSDVVVALDAVLVSLIGNSSRRGIGASRRGLRWLRTRARLPRSCDPGAGAIKGASRGALPRAGGAFLAGGARHGGRVASRAARGCGDVKMVGWRIEFPASASTPSTPSRWPSSGSRSWVSRSEKRTTRGSAWVLPEAACRPSISCAFRAEDGQEPAALRSPGRRHQHGR